MFPDLTDLVFERALVAAAAGRPRPRRRRCFEDCLERGDAPSRYSPTVGCGSFLALVRLAELEAARGDVERAEGLLRRCLREHPAYLGTVLPLAAAMLARGDAPAEVVAQIEGGGRRPRPRRSASCSPPLSMRRARRRPPNRSTRRSSTPSRATAAPAWRWPRRCSRPAATKRPPRPPRRSPTRTPSPTARRARELFARVLAGMPTDEARTRARRGAASPPPSSTSSPPGRRSAPVPRARPGAAPTRLATMLEALLRVAGVRGLRSAPPRPRRDRPARPPPPRPARRDLPAARLPRLGRGRVDRRGARRTVPTPRSLDRPRPRRRRPRPHRGRRDVRAGRPRTCLKFGLTRTITQNE